MCNDFCIVLIPIAESLSGQTNEKSGNIFYTSVLENLNPFCIFNSFSIMNVNAQFILEVLYFFHLISPLVKGLFFV